MPKPKDPSRKKGSFGPIRLPVAGDLVYPTGYRNMMIIGGTLAGIIALFFFLDTFVLNDTFSSPGGLSSNHANFETECSNCHEPWGGATSQKCSTCHEKTNDGTGIYSFAAHYLYRSGDHRRVQTGGQRTADDERECSSCHPEHQGRDAAITVIPDEKCTPCHDFGSFEDGHPEFAFAREVMPDDSTLAFTHVRHTRFVYERLQKQSASVYLEKACLYCHNAEPDGKAFKPLDFEAHCSDCHLTAGTKTPNLAISDPADPAAPGVETLGMIQQRREPGTLWAFYTNPNEFAVSPRGVVKSPVYHRDPWIMENLRQLSATLFGPETNLAGLLPIRRSKKPGMEQKAYEEAIGALKEHAQELRSRPEPEVQRDLTTIDSLLLIAERRSLMTAAALPLDLFMTKPNPALTGTQQQDLQDFARRLTEPCLLCHQVEDAGILPVRIAQRTMVRAEFDHRAHVLERRCLDCHTDIPVGQALLQGDTTGVRQADRASVHNIPRIDNCRQCHGVSGASDACATCHFMHPNKKNRGDLQLAVDRK